MADSIGSSIFEGNDRDPVWDRDVTWENNESVEALKKLLPLTLSMSEYGGFEQVGKIGTSLPNNDERITANAGDIVLYSGDKMISGSYTRLGRIAGKAKRS